MASYYSAYSTWQTRTVIEQHRSPLGTDSSEAYITYALSGVCSLQASPAATGTQTQAAEGGAPKQAAAVEEKGVWHQGRIQASSGGRAGLQLAHYRFKSIEFYYSIS
jgi:hypothetical protein